MIKSKVLSDLKWMSWPNSTIFSLSVTDVAFEQPALSTIWNCSQNYLTCVHYQNIWLIESRQKEQVMSFSIPMCIKTTLVAIILCTSLIWNHFSFISWICCIFLKVIHQLISLFSLASHLSQQLGLVIFTFSKNHHLVI